VGEALQQEKVTPSSGHQSPGEISIFSFSVLDKRAGEASKPGEGS